MTTYSRRSSMPHAGDVPRITGLNSFGQPFRGRKIMGIGSDLKDIRADQADQAERAAAAERGRQMALRMAAATSSPTAAAPAKRPGQMIPGNAPGASRWASGDELDRMEKKKSSARKRARQTTNYMPRVRTLTYAPMERMA